MRWRWLLLCAPLAALAGSAALGPFTFEEIADRAGVHFVSNNGATARKQQPEGLIAGVAVFDYDGDGYPDLYFVNGASLPSLAKEGPQHRNRLYHNNGDLTFTDVTEKAGLGGAGYGMGAARRTDRGRGRLRLRRRRLSGSLLRQGRKPAVARQRGPSTPEPALSQQRRSDLHRRHGKSRTGRRRCCD